MPPTTVITLERTADLCLRALRRSGLGERSSAAVSRVVVAAERDGCHSHGLFRIPGYCAASASGEVDGKATPLVEDVAPGLVRVDAAGGFAPLAFEAGREMLVDKARTQGVACLAIRRSSHFAALWYETEWLAQEPRGLVSFAFVNSKVRVGGGGSVPGAQRWGITGTRTVPVLAARIVILVDPYCAVSLLEAVHNMHRVILVDPYVA